MKFTEEQITQTIDDMVYEINWQKVSSVMRHLNWEWSDGIQAYVPSAVELIQTARKHARKAIMSSLRDPEVRGYTVGSGGIYAYCSLSEDKIYLKVWFALETADNYD